MQNKNWGLERVWSGLGWGIFFILIGGLIFAGNKGWVSESHGWLYFAIGTGAILIIEFLVHFFSNQANRWSSLGQPGCGTIHGLYRNSIPVRFRRLVAAGLRPGRVRIHY